jgi:FKBP-type peptidyl-prolyl cis-trans isomerase
MLTVKEGDESAQVGAAGDTFTVHYTGWLPSGQLFDTSKQPGREPFSVQIPGGVIAGWNEGLLGMRVGETRRLFIPPSLGYGERGAGGVIPPNSWLVFDVELLGLGDNVPAQPAAPASGGLEHDHDGDGIPDH